MTDTFNHTGLAEEGDYAVLLVEDGRWTTHCYVSRDYAAAKAATGEQASFSRKVDGIWSAHEDSLDGLDAWLHAATLRDGARVATSTGALGTVEGPRMVSPGGPIVVRLDSSPSHVMRFYPSGLTLVDPDSGTAAPQALPAPASAASPAARGVGTEPAVAPVELAHFTSYDLGRLHTALVDVAQDLGRDTYGLHVLWGRSQELLPWDHRYGRCWDDPTFSPRYQWLRARLVPEDAKHDYPLGSIVDALAELVAERVALDPEEPF